MRTPDEHSATEGVAPAHWRRSERNGDASIAPVMPQPAVAFMAKHSSTARCAGDPLVAVAIAPVAVGLAIPFVGLEASAEAAVGLVPLVEAGVGVSSNPASTGSSFLRTADSRADQEAGPCLLLGS